MTILIGADPEVFWKNDVHVVSVIGKLGGNKHKCRKVTDIINVLEDNVAAEFNFPPCSNSEEFIRSISQNLEFLEQEANKYGATLARGLSSALFPPSELKDPRAFVFGCEPDYNAYTEKINPPPMTDSPFLRSCGGHVHVGSGHNNFNDVRAMDLFLGVSSIQFDNDTKRRSLYGKAGACRMKPYGFEYRTLSNFWTFDKQLIEWVYDRTLIAVEWAKHNFIDPTSDLAHLIQDTINNNDFKSMEKVFNLVPEASV